MTLSDDGKNCRALAARIVMVLVLTILGSSESSAVTCPTGILTAAPSAQKCTCPIGAEVDDPFYCQYFRYFAAAGTAVDDRISDRVGATTNNETRSIALIVGVSEYKNPTLNLPAVKNDVIALTSFLQVDQKFDEIIVLEDAQASRETLSYFINTYLVSQALNYPGKGRLLFTYSGHGVPGNGPLATSLLLSNATSQIDVRNMYTLISLKSSFEALARGYFHVLALVNACYGGDIFDIAATGGNMANGFEKGAHAVTAGPKGDLVWSDGIAGHGSVFFDELIRGIKSGDADPYEIQKFFDPSSGAITQRRLGIVSLNGLISYLTSEIQNMNYVHKSKGAAASTFPQLSPPWVGSLEPPRQVAEGGFFFLSPRDVVPVVPSSPAAELAAPAAPKAPPHVPAAHGAPPQAPEALPTPGKGPVSPFEVGQSGEIFAGFRGSATALDHATSAARVRFDAAILSKITQRPVSSVPKRPDIKVFNPPDQYPIHGVDVSRFEGDIDWKRVAKLGISFAYIRATAPRIVDDAVVADNAFSKHWEQTRENHMSRGAYLVFSYCQLASVQFDQVIKVIPAEEDALPIAIDFEQYPKGIFKAESECAAKVSDTDLRINALELLEKVQDRYGKVPVIYGATAILSRVLDERFNRYMIWLASYPRGGASRQEDLRLAGNNPWTLWQYTGTATVDGIGRNVDLNVFFGNAAQFELFKDGKVNAALVGND